MVIVYFGGNDSMLPHSTGLGPHVPLPEYIENMRKIALHLKVIVRIIGIQTIEWTSIELVDAYFEV